MFHCQKHGFEMDWFDSKTAFTIHILLLQDRLFAIEIKPTLHQKLCLRYLLFIEDRFFNSVVL